MNIIDIGLYVAYIAFFLAIGALILFPIFSFIKGNMKNAKTTLFGLLAFVVVLLLAYVISPADQGLFYEKMKIGPNASKLIGAGLISTYIVMATLAVITVYSVVVKWFK